MKLKSISPVLLLAALSLSACSTGQIWRHPSKNLTDLRVDDRACANLAENIAKQQSLVKQPNIHILQQAHSQCMISQGWKPSSLQKEKLPDPVPVKIEAKEERTIFIAGTKRITLPGHAQIISQEKYGALLERSGHYLYINLQYNSPFTFVPTYPELLPGSTLFDQNQDQNLRATFYYLEVDHKLIFGCTAYLLPEKNSRIVVSLTKELFQMPANFMNITRSEFSQVLELQEIWWKLLSDINRQS